MIGKFKEAFKKNDNSKLSQILVDSLTSKLPEGFRYTKLNKDTLLLTPHNEGNVTITIKDIEQDLPKNVKITNSRELALYLHNSQQPITVNSNKLIINNYEFGVDEILKRPFQNNLIEGMLTLKPTPFKHPIDITISSIKEDIEFNVKLKRLPYKDVYIQRHRIIGIQGINIDFFINLENNYVSMNLNYNLNKETKVGDFLKKLKLIRAFQENTVLVNNVEFYPNNIDKHQSLDLEINPTINFWEKVYALEKLFKITITPKIDIDEEEYYQIIKLYKSLIEKFGTKQYINVNSFVVTTDLPLNETKLTELKDSKTLLSFMQNGELKLLGTDITIYIVRAWYEYKIENIELEDNNTNVYTYKIYLNADNLKGLIEYTMYFLTEEDSENYIKDSENITKNYKEAKFYNEED